MQTEQMEEDQITHSCMTLADMLGYLLYKWITILLYHYIIVSLYILQFNSIGTQIDPLGQPKVMAGRDHCFRTCCPSVCSPSVSKQCSLKGLAEWIIDDTCLVYSVFSYIVIVILFHTLV